ncbi:MAG: response regulator transcription factor [Thermoanaerobaculia bacterium]|nr:response regulator transcription factor [Thermoanaerobaculia bacterium]
MKPAPITQRRVLIVEDEPEIAELMAIHLRDIGCEVEVVHDGLSGLRRGQSEHFDLIILDLRLPGLDGLEVCRRLQQGEHYTPILMVTARGEEVDRVLGLEVGADDYLTKPFSVRELVARAAAIFRRVDLLRGDGKTIAGQPVVIAGDLVLDRDRRLVEVGGTEIPLTAKEFDLLVRFASNPERVYTRSQLLDLVWGAHHAGSEHTVNSHINRLRSKIEVDPANPRHIETVWGVGYRFCVHSDSTGVEEETR